MEKRLFPRFCLPPSRTGSRQPTSSNAGRLRPSRTTTHRRRARTGFARGRGAPQPCCYGPPGSAQTELVDQKVEERGLSWGVVESDPECGEGWIMGVTNEAADGHTVIEQQTRFWLIRPRNDEEVGQYRRGEVELDRRSSRRCPLTLIRVASSGACFYRFAVHEVQRRVPFGSPFL